KALRDADWQKAMEAEWNSFEELEVCDVVPKSEAAGGQVLRAVWVLTRKTTAEGEIIHKARLCADGSRAWPHGESYAPVIDKESLRTVVGLAWQNGMHLENFDVKTAYLYGTLDEPRYMVVPPGILPHVDRASNVLKLKKSVYGLPEAGRVWNDTFTDHVVTSMGFKRLISSPAVYLLRQGEDRMSTIGVHVDDGIVASTDEATARDLLAALEARFSLKIMGIAPRFLGMQQEVLSGGDLLWHQEEKVLALLDTFDDQTLRPASVPMSTTTMQHVNEATGPLLEPTEQHRYHSAVGSVLYLVQNCRPDIALAVGILSRFVQQPRVEHWRALLLLLGYLSKTSKAGLLFKRGTYRIDEPVNITVYTDADFATVADCKSTSGVCIFMRDTLVAFASKKQTTVARSTTEAEANALKLALTMLEFEVQFLGELGVVFTTPVVYEDNTAVIALMTNTHAYRARTKHLLVAFSYCRQMVRSGTVDLRYISTVLMIADLLTKPLPRVCYEMLRGLLGMWGF
ncbi:unnamed protein product, partial [Heterosigma akashiwo]